MCCKLYDVPAVPKKAGAWCPHCAVGQGCKIYDERPDLCREFVCLWIQDAGLPEDWKPEKSKMVATVSAQTGFIHVRCDPASPNAWRRDPHHSYLRSWSRQLLERRSHLLVFVGEQAHLIMPEQDVPLGKMSPETSFAVKRTFGPQGVAYEVTLAP
jgi:hypothetical protein